MGPVVKWYDQFRKRPNKHRFSAVVGLWLDQDFFSFTTCVAVLDKHARLVDRIFLNFAIGAAYTLLSLGPDGKIYTENDGHLFVVGE